MGFMLFHPLLACPFFMCARREKFYKMQITFRTTLLEATLMCHSNTRENHWLLLNFKPRGKCSWLDLKVLKEIKRNRETSSMDERQTGKAKVWRVWKTTSNWQWKDSEIHAVFAVIEQTFHAANTKSLEFLSIVILPKNRSINIKVVERVTLAHEWRQTPIEPAINSNTSCNLSTCNSRWMSMLSVIDR